MNGVPAPRTEAYAAVRERAGRAERLADERLDALAAVREAIDIPHAATVGDDETRTAILLHRIRHLSMFLERALDDKNLLGLPWSVAYLRERLAEHPAEGYKTWDEAVAELHDRKDGE